MRDDLPQRQRDGHSDFVRMVLAEFPELRGELEEFDDLLHLQMGAFARFVQQAKGRAAWDVYVRALRVVNELWAHAEPALQNAINVSFLEHIDFKGSRGATAWNYLSPSVRDAWRHMKEYNDTLAARLGRTRGKHS